MSASDLPSCSSLPLPAPLLLSLPARDTTKCTLLSSHALTILITTSEAPSGRAMTAMANDVPTLVMRRVKAMVRPRSPGLPTGISQRRKESSSSSSCCCCCFLTEVGRDTAACPGQCMLSKGAGTTTGRDVWELEGR